MASVETKGRPVTLFFESKGNQRMYRLPEYIDEDLVGQREKVFDFCLTRWGSFQNPFAIRFVMIVDGHVASLGSSELLAEYLRKAMGSD